MLPVPAEDNYDTFRTPPSMSKKTIRILDEGAGLNGATTGQGGTAAV